MQDILSAKAEALAGGAPANVSQQKHNIARSNYVRSRSGCLAAPRHLGRDGAIGPLHLQLLQLLPCFVRHGAANRIPATPIFHHQKPKRRLK